MGLAPTPGKTPNAAANAAKRTAMHISKGEETWTLNVDDLGPADDILSRKATGLPVTPFFEEDKFGADSLLILLWFARRKSGEPTLQWQAVLDEYPTYGAIADAEFDIKADEEADEDDPLASDES